MDVSIGTPAVNGMREVTVDYRETVDGYAFSATLNVWVEDSDSRSEIEARAMGAARDFARRMLSAHSA